MIKGLRGATIWSEDLNNLLPFYRDLLGLSVGIQIPGFVVLGERGAPALALGTHSEVRGRNRTPRGIWWASAATTSTPTGSGSRPPAWSSSSARRTTVSSGSRP